MDCSAGTTKKRSSTTRSRLSLPVNIGDLEIHAATKERRLSVGSGPSRHQGSGSDQTQPDVRLLAECLRYANGDQVTLKSTLQAVATLCSSSVEACNEFLHLGVLETVGSIAFGDRESGNFPRGYSTAEEVSEIENTCQEGALRVLACAANASDLVRVSLSNEKILKSVCCVLETLDSSHVVTSANLLLSTLLNGSGHVFELCWREGVFQRLCDLFTTFLTRALQTWEEARQADADNSDERVVSAVVSSLCVSMSSTNTNLVKDVQSLVSQLFPLSKVAVDRALVQGESVRDDFLCRLCKLLSTAINNNCANQDRFRICGMLGALLQSLRCGFNSSKMSSNAMALHIEVITASCSDNDVNKAYLCKNNAVSLYAQLLTHRDCISGGTLATHLLLAILCVIDFNEASIKEFIDHGAVPTLIRTVINSKDSDVHKAAVLILDIVNQHQQTMPVQRQQHNLNLESCLVGARNSSVMHGRSSELATSPLHPASWYEPSEDCYTTASKATPRRSSGHGFNACIDNYNRALEGLTSRQPVKSEGLPSSLLHGTNLLSSSQDNSSKSRARHGSCPATSSKEYHTAFLTPTSIPPPPSNSCNKPARQRRSAPITRNKIWVEKEMHGVSDIDSSTTRYSSHAKMQSWQGAMPAATEPSGPGSTSYYPGPSCYSFVESCCDTDAESRAIDGNPVDCIVCNMTKLGCITSRSFVHDHLTHSRARLCAEHRSSKWNLEEFAAASSCAESDASFTKPKRRRSRATHAADRSDTSAVFEPQRSKKRKLLSRRVLASHTMSNDTATGNAPKENTLSGRSSAIPQGTTVIGRKISRLVSTKATVTDNADSARADEYASNCPIQPVLTVSSTELGEDNSVPARTPHSISHLEEQDDNADRYSDSAVIHTLHSTVRMRSTRQKVSRSEAESELGQMRQPSFPADLLDMSMDWRLSDVDAFDTDHKLSRRGNPVHDQESTKVSHAVAAHTSGDTSQSTLRSSKRIRRMKASSTAGQNSITHHLQGNRKSKSFDPVPTVLDESLQDGDAVSPPCYPNASSGVSQRRLLSYRCDDNLNQSDSDEAAVKARSRPFRLKQGRLPREATASFSKRQKSKAGHSAITDSSLPVSDGKIYPRFGGRVKSGHQAAVASSEDGVLYDKENDALWSKLLGEDDSPTLQRHSVFAKSVYGRDGKKTGGPSSTSKALLPSGGRHGEFETSSTVASDVVDMPGGYSDFAAPLYQSAPPVPVVPIANDHYIPTKSWKAINSTEKKDISRQSKELHRGLRVRDSNTSGLKSKSSNMKQKLPSSSARLSGEGRVVPTSHSCYDFDDGNLSCASIASEFGDGYTKSGRRQRLPMEPWEVQNLLLGVEKMGNQWAHIRASFPFLERRTAADLRTKYRQLQKSGTVEGVDAAAASNQRQKSKPVNRRKLLRL